MIVEVVGGYVTNSLALLSDAGHMLSDAVSLGIALIAFIIAEKGHFLTSYLSETLCIVASISQYIPNFFIFENTQYCALKTLKT